MGLIAARTTKSDQKAAHGISIFLVDTRDHSGFKKGKTLKKLGQPTYDTAELFFDDIRLPSSAILGEKSCLSPVTSIWSTRKVKTLDNKKPLKKGASMDSTKASTT